MVFHASLCCLSVCYLCGTLVTAGATSLGGLLAGQFVVGVGVAFSVASNIAYVTEMVPAERSGAMVALYELATTFGIDTFKTILLVNLETASCLAPLSVFAFFDYHARRSWLVLFCCTRRALGVLGVSRAQLCWPRMARHVPVRPRVSCAAIRSRCHDARIPQVAVFSRQARRGEGSASRGIRRN
jgi:MFS family permease